MAKKKIKPDYSSYLAHFTTDREPRVYDSSNPVLPHTTNKSALNRLISILSSKTIYASSMPWTKQNCVPFTECPWTSLLTHAEIYSSYGLGFTKEFIFNNGGAPVFYVRADRWNDADWKSNFCFVTPFWPSYRKQREVVRDKIRFSSEVDYSHEREWRVPQNLSFDYSDLSFVIVKQYDDIARIGTSIINAIGGGGNFDYG
ncbi:hypothetical protein EZS27_015724 [termite gut metagenome]|uniref:Uncharacterized protein n=1 Tax=termite gut metagenome TaxID=433724 RepID=A0A5J4RQ94_9ZZZZ